MALWREPSGEVVMAPGLQALLLVMQYTVTVFLGLPPSC
jgi:hypothetical protein